jgi:hypothetical protein
LQPPAGGGPIWLERFSPYFVDSTFPVRDVCPWEVYQHIYPADRIDLGKIAYFFNYRMEDVVPRAELEPLRTAINAWRERWKQSPRPVLVYQRAPGWLQTIDRRDPAAAQVHAFHGPEAAAYELCGDTDHTPSMIKTLLHDTYGMDVDEATITQILNRFCDLGLMLNEQEHYLSLALPVNGNW